MARPKIMEDKAKDRRENKIRKSLEQQTQDEVGVLSTGSEGDTSKPENTSKTADISKKSDPLTLPKSNTNVVEKHFLNNESSVELMDDIDPVKANVITTNDKICNAVKSMENSNSQSTPITEGNPPKRTSSPGEQFRGEPSINGKEGDEGNKPDITPQPNDHLSENADAKATSSDWVAAKNCENINSINDINKDVLYPSPLLDNNTKTGSTRNETYTSDLLPEPMVALPDVLREGIEEVTPVNIYINFYKDSVDGKNERGYEDAKDTGYIYPLNEYIRIFIASVGLDWVTEQCAYIIPRIKVEDFKVKAKKAGLNIVIRNSLNINKDIEMMTTDELQSSMESNLCKKVMTDIVFYIAFCKTMCRLHRSKNKLGKKLADWYSSIGLKEREAEKLVVVGRMLEKGIPANIGGYHKSALEILAPLNEVGLIIIKKDKKYICEDLRCISKNLPRAGIIDGDSDDIVIEKLDKMLVEIKEQKKLSTNALKYIDQKQSEEEHHLANSTNNNNNISMGNSCKDEELFIDDEVKMDKEDISLHSENETNTESNVDPKKPDKNQVIENAICTNGQLAERAINFSKIIKELKKVTETITDFCEQFPQGYEVAVNNTEALKELNSCVGNIKFTIEKLINIQNELTNKGGG